jgi:hypothetical protein
MAVMMMGLASFLELGGYVGKEGRTRKVSAVWFVPLPARQLCEHPTC